MKTPKPSSVLSRVSFGPLPNFDFTSVIIVGDAITFGDTGGKRPDIFGYHYIDAEELNEALIDSLAPTLVVSKLFSAPLDAIEIAGRLALAGYVGAYGILIEQSLDTHLIEREIRNAAPQIQAKLIFLDQLRSQS